MTPPAPLPALSTMWAVQPRFERDLPAFLARTAELGYGAVEINHSMDAAQAGAILAAARGGAIPVTGVHGPAPLQRHGGRENRALNPAATDEAERRLAVADHCASVDLAAEAGAGVVVVHLGHIGGIAGGLLPGERRLRGMFDRGEQAQPAWAATVEETRRERDALAAPWLEAARRTLAELAAHAAARGVTLGIETRLHFHEIPGPAELARLLEEYPPEVAGYLHDVGHAEVQHRLGLTDRAAWWEHLGSRLAGLHLHDVAGLRDHRAPGNGDVDFRWLAARIAEANPLAARTFEIDQREPDEAVAAGLQLLIETGVVPA